MAVESLFIDDKTRTKLEDLAEVGANLWPLDCQSCGKPLGQETPSLVVRDLVTFAAAGLHHKTCQEPQWQDEGAVQVHSTPVLTYLTNAFLLPVATADGPIRQPFILVNPSLEQVMLEPGGEAGWKVATMQMFRRFGLVPMGPELRVNDPVEGAVSRIRGSEVWVELPTAVGAGPWQVTGNQEFLQQIRRQEGVMLGVSTAVHPAQVSEPRDLIVPLEQGEVAMGWIALQD